MKTLMTLAAALLISAPAFAQTGTTGTGTGTRADVSPSPAAGPMGIVLGAEGELALPIGNYADFTGLGIGAYLTGEWRGIQTQPMLGLTGRIGFQFHLSKSHDVGFGSADYHIHALPILVGAKYYLQNSTKNGAWVQGEAGFFYLMSGASQGNVSGSSSDLKFGLGARVGYQLEALSVFAGYHFHDIGHPGDSMMLTAGAGYQFAGL